MQVLFAVLTPSLLLAAATTNVPSWVDSVSRVGVVGMFLLAAWGLHNRRWWVPSWAYRELDARHERLRRRLDRVVDLAVRTTRNSERTTSLLDAALDRAVADDERGA